MTFSRPTSRRQLIGTSFIAIGIIGGALCRNPYRQAHERGVKIIGATAHYVSEELDAGPIIDQEIVRVSHRESEAEMKNIGRDIEKLTLARAVKAHLENRVAFIGNRTIVF